ncbi:helix-turn-helix domain-containing protein [Caulobacter soli]|uniref:helix-turn-helix domain-containing protein n=1 Tax=Caulobacter soli TaxID=2708539 RepID=UPI0013EBA1A7|nr:helix-turn-helix domain-containing protein [Caulobacter soli]
MNDQTEGRRPNPVDLHVGGRVRMRRKILGVSQDQLAASLGLTFQQVQKYERGSNRVSASKLYQIAKTLQVPISFFFDGLADPTDSEAPDSAASKAEQGIQTFLATSEGLELAQLFPRIGRGRVRRQVLDLVRTMTDDTGEGEA